MKPLSLSNSPKPALLDDDIYEVVKPYQWHLSHYGYAARNIGGRKDRQIIYLHQIPIGCPLKSLRLDIDHVNQNKLDNRRENLRFVSRRLNNLNSSRKTWVTPHQDGWRVRFRVGKKMVVDVAGIETKEQALSIAHLIRGALIFEELTRGK
jgi:HNH endonuclease